jgi:hypothetical protein
MKAQPEALLTALLDACRRGLVTHEEAAKLVGIRKEDFSDLVAWRMVECAVWRCYVAAFHRAFPWCDSNAWRVPHVENNEDQLWRPPTELHIAHPEPENGDAWENMHCDDRSPAHHHRALLRVVGQLSNCDRPRSGGRI